MVGKDVSTVQRRASEKGFQLRYSVSGANRILVKFVHGGGIATAVPPDVQRIGEHSRAPQVAQQDGGAGLGHTRHFREKILWLGEMVKHRVAHDQIE